MSFEIAFFIVSIMSIFLYFLYKYMYIRVMCILYIIFYILHNHNIRYVRVREVIIIYTVCYEVN